MLSSQKKRMRDETAFRYLEKDDRIFSDAFIFLNLEWHEIVGPCPTVIKPLNEKENTMANCCDMKEGDLFVCEVCGLELTVKKPCSCDIEAPEKCTVPLQCCKQDMVKK